MKKFCIAAIIAIGISAWLVQDSVAQPAGLEPGFAQSVKPFLDKNCVACHNAENLTAGVRVDQLDASLDDKHVRVWEGVLHRVRAGTMPPKGLPQPSAEDREKIVQWVEQGLEIARLRPSPKNGSARRLTVAQYRNTIRELLGIQDNLTEILPPDAISSDGFVNNQETLQLSPLLIEAYLEIAEEALNRAIIDPAAKPKVQNFRMDLGAKINKNPIPDKLVLGANSMLLENEDFTVTQLTPQKPFPFDPFFMRTQYRFIEGYQGNDTVRGWREYDSIYHAVFACMRGTPGYPKGKPYDTVAGGLLLRPAIPNEELFDEDGSYGHKANFKISLRELPDMGRFRVTVKATRYDDGLLLDPGVAARTGAGIAARAQDTVNIPAAGIYQVDVHAAPRQEPSLQTDTSRLQDGLIAIEPKLQGNAKSVTSPFGKATSLDGDLDWLEANAVPAGDGDFTLAAWIRPGQMKRAGLLSQGRYDWTHGWFLDIPDGRGRIRLETAGPDNQSNGGIFSPAGVLRPNVWQHVAAVVRRGENESRIYVNGYLVAKGSIGAASLFNPKMGFQIGRVGQGPTFAGDVDKVHVYNRAISEPELQALIEPGRQFAKAPPEKAPDIELLLGHREFTGTLQQPAFVAVRLPAGPLKIATTSSGMSGIASVKLTPLPLADPVARRFASFEKRNPLLGVYLGLRRDCGSTLAPVGKPQRVQGGELQTFIFEDEISNYPSPNVEKNNVNYLAGVREIGVRSEFTDGRDMPRLRIRSVEFEGPFYETWPPPAHRQIFIPSESRKDSPAYARQVIRNFATRAYRRPVTTQEAAALFAVFDKSYQANKNFRQGIKEALSVALTSPQFLFLVEKSTTPQPEPLAPHELASKLSYFLWNGPPDRTTLRLAANGTLAQNLDAEVQRLIAEPRFERFVEEFTSQWLSLDKIQVLEPDRKRYPDLTRDTRTQLRREPVEYLRHLIRQNLPVRNLVDSDTLLANEVVATYYGLGDKVESGFDFVAIPHGRKELGGLLTQASILAGLSDGRESNPVKRGAWLARRIVAEPPADPPPNVPALGEDTKGLTLRQRIEQHRSQSGCFQCHTKIDPWGIALEEFDAGGRLKKEVVDASSKLPDNTEVKGALDLKRYLAEDRIDQVAFSLLKHLAVYANGRSLTYNEVNHLKQDGLKLKAGGYRMKDMIRYTVNSKLFLEK